MSAYFAPAFFAHLLGKCLQRKHPIIEVMKLGFVVVGTFAVIWWPYLFSLEAVLEVDLHFFLFICTFMHYSFCIGSLSMKCKCGNFVIFVKGPIPISSF